MQLIRKISAASLGWRKPEIQSAVLIARNEAVPLYRVGGVATGIRTGKSKFDDREETSEWIALTGRFRAFTKHKDGEGETFESGVCFMPGYVVDAVAGQLSAETTGVRFAYDIMAKYDEKSATSYTFHAVSLLEPAEDDPLDTIVGPASNAMLASRDTKPAIEAPKAKTKA